MLARLQAAANQCHSVQCPASCVLISKLIGAVRQSVRPATLGWSIWG